MVPSIFIEIDEIPLSPNGKVNREALPHPSFQKSKRQPVNDETAMSLAKIWAEVLALDLNVIGEETNFFQAGGHSLKAMKLINLIHKQMQVKIDFDEVFSHPTIATLADLVKKKDSSQQIKISKLSAKSHYELSYAQKRLWLLYELNPQDTAFNLLGSISLPLPIDIKLATKVIDQLIYRHESFRTRFKKVDNQPVQVIEQVIKPNIEVVDLNHLSLNKAKKKIQNMYRKASNTPFDLERELPWRIKIIKHRNGQADLFVTMHHIITDGWSMEVLKQEFQYMYSILKKNSRDLRESLPIQYKEYAAWQNNLLADGSGLLDAKRFWKSELQGGLSPVHLPYDYPQKKHTLKSCAGFSLPINSPLTKQLKHLAQTNNATLFMILLAAFNGLLAIKSRQNRMVIGFPGAARKHEDLKKIIGFFVNTLILKNDIDKQESFMNLLKRIQKKTLQVLEYQDYPLELIFAELRVKYPDINVFFNMLNQQDTQYDILSETEPRHFEYILAAKFDLELYVQEYKNGIRVDAHYDKNLFKPVTIERLMGAFLDILAKICLDPNLKLQTFIKPAKRLQVKLN